MNMKYLLILLLAVPFSFNSTAQSVEEVNEYWEEVLALEKSALIRHTADYELWRMSTNRTNSPKELPYPQMKILVDSMQRHIDNIQSQRRDLAGQRNAFIARAEKKKVKKDDQAKEIFANIEGHKEQQLPSLISASEGVEALHQQFENLKMLYGIKALTYGDYRQELVGQVEPLEERYGEQTKVIAELRVEQRKALDAENMEAAARLQNNISELEKVHEMGQAKLTQLYNYQDRLGTTNADEVIYMGPGMTLPYELEMMKGEVGAFEEQLNVFDVLREDQIRNQ